MTAKWEKAVSSSILFTRLPPGADVIEALEQVLNEAGIRAGTIVSCIGSLRSASFHIAVPADNPIGASYSEPIGVNGPLELLGGQGTVGPDEKGDIFIHLHAVFSDGKGNLRGGHLVKGGNPVLITCEITMACLEGMHIQRKYDPEVDMAVFNIQRQQG
jgi:predicted DNA-binding protein with PD1-like motif